MVLWLTLGYGSIMVAAFLQNPVIFGVGYVLTVAGLLAQTYFARIAAQPFDFLKSPVRSFYAETTQVVQFRYRSGRRTFYSDWQCPSCGKDYHPHVYAQHFGTGLCRTYTPPKITGLNLTEIALEEAYLHPRYGELKFLFVEHDGEWEDHVPKEGGEITYWNIAGVWHNNAPIVDLWETPRTHPIPLHVYPIYCFARGPAGDYNRWVEGELRKLDQKTKMETLPFVRMR